MFTGLISDVGSVALKEGSLVKISSGYDPSSIAIGASIACDGCCLTVTNVEPATDGSIFSLDVSNETFACTRLGDWREGDKINLERSLKLGDELGGHLVSGHVDGLGEIMSRTADGDSVRFEIEVPEALAPYIASKGSVALNGTSLTVNDVSKNRFDINIIPHTLKVTTWGLRQPGDRCNVEVDLLARYVARQIDYRK